MNQKTLLYNVQHIFCRKNSPLQCSTHSSISKNIAVQIELLCFWKYCYFQAIILLLLKHQCSLSWCYLIKIWKVIETRLTVTCMIVMMYNEAVIHIYYFTGIDLVPFGLSFSKFIRIWKVFCLWFEVQWKMFKHTFVRWFTIVSISKALWEWDRGAPQEQFHMQFIIHSYLSCCFW